MASASFQMSITIPCNRPVFVGNQYAIQHANTLIPEGISGYITQCKVEPGRLRFFVTRVSKELTTALKEIVVPQLPADEPAFNVLFRKMIMQDIVMLTRKVHLLEQQLHVLNDVWIQHNTRETAPGYDVCTNYQARHHEIICQLNEANSCIHELSAISASL